MSGDQNSGVGNKRRLVTTAPLGLAVYQSSGFGSTKNPPISSDEALPMADTSSDNSDNENNSEEDELDSSVAKAIDVAELSGNNSDNEKKLDVDGLKIALEKGLHSSLSMFLCAHNLPRSLLSDKAFYGAFLAIAYFKDVGNLNATKLRSPIALLFCKHAFPPKMTEDRFFREFLNVRISEANIRADCLGIFYQEKDKIKDMFESMDVRISLSAEILTHEAIGFDPSSRQSYSGEPQYLCLKAHFIDEFWKRKKLVLGFYKFGNGYKQYSVIAVKKSLSGWGIDSKVNTLTIGRDIISDEIFQSVKARISGKSELQVNGCQFRVLCCADLLNRMAQLAFKKIASEMGDIQLISPWPKSPPLWYLTLSHLKRALELESEGEFEKDLYKDYDVPSPAEWIKVRGVYKFVETIYNVAKTLFDTKLSTAPMFFHGLLELQSYFKKETESSEVFVSRIAEDMLGKLKEYWDDMSLVLSIATVMDPRCKMKFVEFFLSKFKTSDQNSEIALVQEAIQSLYSDYAAKTVFKMEYPPSDLSSDLDEEEEDDENMQMQNKKKPEPPEDLCKWVNEYEEFIKTNNQPVKSELIAYLEESVIPWSNNFSALSWWRGARHQYPILSKMAQEFLAIPLSLATSHDAYSTGKRHTDDRVCRLDREMRNPLICTQSWLRKR